MIRPSIACAVFVVLTCISSCTKTCDEGYEGNRCDVESRKKFLGVWSVTDTPGRSGYSNTIIEGVLVTEVLFTGYFGIDTIRRPVKAKIAGDQISVARQQPDTSKVYIVASGTMAEDQHSINWSFTRIDARDTVETSASYNSVWAK